MAVATWNYKIQVPVSLGSPSIELADFTTPLLVGSSMGAGFTDAYREYRSVGDVAGDSDLNAALTNILTKMFAQASRPPKVVVGKLGLVANVWRLSGLAPGAVGNKITVTVLAQSAEFTSASGAETPAAIVDALKAALDGIDPALDITTLDEGDTLLITGDVLGEDLGVSVAVTGTAAATATEVTEAQDWDARLQALYDATSWYYLLTESAVTADILKAAVWAESAKRLYLPQSLEAGILDASVTDDIAAQLVTALYQQTGLVYSSSNTDYKAAAYCANRAAFDPGLRSAPWDAVPLVGLTPESITPTQRAAALASKVNLFLKLRGLSVMGEGTVAAGYDIDHVITANWIQTRMEEAIASLKTRLAAAGMKLELTRQGQTAVLTEAKTVLSQAQRAGAIKAGWQVSAPDIGAIPLADYSAGIMRYSFGADPVKTAKQVQGQGYVFDGAAELQLAA